MRIENGLRRNWSKLVAVFLLAGGMACASKAPSTTDLSVAQEVLRSVHFKRADLISVEAQARGEIRQGGRKLRFLASILAHMREGAFIEVGGFGFPVLHVLVRGDEVTVYIPSEGRAFQGRGAKAMRELIGVPVEPEEWTQLLLGKIPPHPQELRGSKAKRKKCVLTTREGRREVILEVERESGWLSRFWEKRPRDMAYTFGEPKTTKYGEIPSSLKLMVPGKSLKLDFRQVVPNPSIPQSHLQLDIPPGIPLEPLRRVKLLQRG